MIERGPFRNLVWLGVMVLVSCDGPRAAGGSGGAAGAGASSGDASTSDDPVDVGGDAAHETVPDAGDGDDAVDGRSIDVPYSGVVLATILQSGSTISYQTYADFIAAPAPDFSRCGGHGPSVRDCCCMVGISTPTPEVPPSAGAVTLMSGGAANVLATLTPTDPTYTATQTNLRFYGTAELGAKWSLVPGSYAGVDGQPWSPGDVMLVSATGRDVHPFTGTLRTGALLSGVIPPIGDGPVVIDKTRDLEVSWTPEDGGDATVILRLGQSGTASINCFCAVPDAAAKVTVDASVLGAFDTGSAPSVFELERLVTTPASADNANIILVGEVARSAPVTFTEPDPTSPIAPGQFFH